MPARLKLDRRRERRLLAIIELGESMAAAARAVGVSKQAVSQRAKRDGDFAARLDAARDVVPHVGALDWGGATAFLEAEYPEYWAPRTGPLDARE